ncbi:4Fe-4S binding protein [Clostridium sp. WILCCON 0269]|uniref:4Fe-4S binding protein n=1 Tax=Candidatus Clostridium eludens TaxID=3381663 RepID=A0ABW8SG17_9CLOT
MSIETKLVNLLDVPEIITPYLHYIYTENDIELMVTIEDNSLSKGEIEKSLNKDMTNALKNAYKNSVINKTIEEEIKYSVNSLDSRLSRMASFERDNWKKIREEDREKISTWIFKKFIDSKKNISINDLIKAGNKILPLEDVIEYLNTIEEDIYVIPCDCKSITERCSFDRNVCITFGNEINSSQNRGHGKKLTKKETIELLKHAEKEGLIHSVEKNAICNCCTCCCYPLRTSEALGLKGKWPKASYIVSIDKDQCINCGICIKRCQLNVFEKKDSIIYMHSSRCIGCGICTTTCPKKALKLQKL